MTAITALLQAAVETYISAKMQRNATVDCKEECGGGEKRNTPQPLSPLRAHNYFREDAIMKTIKIAMLVVTIAVALFILLPNLAWAEDGAALYKAKCAACHGPDGAGKPALKAPSLISDEAKKKTDDEMTKVLASNPKHASVAKALNEEQTKAVIAFVRELQKK